jgi:hypothetical protein
MRSEVFTAVEMHILVFCDVTPCSLVRGTYCLHYTLTLFLCFVATLYQDKTTWLHNELLCTFAECTQQIL